MYSYVTFNEESHLRINVVWDVTPYSLIQVYQLILYCFRLQGLKNNKKTTRRNGIRMLRNYVSPKRRLTSNRSQVSSWQFMVLTLETRNKSRTTCNLCVPCVCVEGTSPCVPSRCGPGDRDTPLQVAAGVQTLVVCSHAASLPANNELHLSQIPMVTVLLLELLHAANLRFGNIGSL
jgi:hypothetical protein